MTENSSIELKKAGISALFKNVENTISEKVLLDSIQELNKRVNVKGQFLNWAGLPEQQLERIDDIYSMVNDFKNAVNTEFLTILGIGGSKHTVEHMLGVNGLNLDNKILFYSDIDSTSFDRYLARIGNDVTNSKYLVASKSGSTYETKDGMLRIRKLLVDAYIKNGLSEESANEFATKHFIAVTDKNPATSELRRLSDSENWLGKLFIHDDVGGRFSSFDDHALFTLAYAGMSKDDMIANLKGAMLISENALSDDIAHNLSLNEAAFWVNAKLNSVKDSIHIYLGNMFEKTMVMHTQMNNESMKDTNKSILLGAECMHHTAEAMYNPANHFAFMVTVPDDKGVAWENVEGYTNAIEKANALCGPSALEKVATENLGLNSVTAGALTQLRAFATIYEEIIEKLARNKALPEVLDSVLQPHVEFYKKNLKPIDGNIPPVVAGRISESKESVLV